MSGDADILMGMTAPVTVLALQAGATALADNPRLRELNAQLGEANTALATENATLKANQLPVVPPTYTVVAGDTLLKIGDKFKVQALRIQAWNNLPDDKIQIGQVLRLTAPEPEPPPEPPLFDTVFGIDVGDIKGTPDEPIPETVKLTDHRAMLGAGLQHVRVFLQTRTLSPTLWTSDQRLAALQPGDSCHITTNLPLAKHTAAFRRMLDATPDHLRGKVLWGVRHEMEADLTTDTAVSAWLDDNQAMADTLDAADGYSPDDLVKTLLFFSQFSDPKLKGSWPKFHGGQDFGMIGMDCYHLQARLNAVKDGAPAGAYTPPEVLFGILVEIAEQTGRPVCAPEWGGTRANTDPTGGGRAQAITDGAAFMHANSIRHASWWCAYGRELNGVRLNHHLDIGGPDTPEVAAYRALMTGA